MISALFVRLGEGQGSAEALSEIEATETRAALQEKMEQGLSVLDFLDSSKARS